MPPFKLFCFLQHINKLFLTGPPRDDVALEEDYPGRHVAVAETGQGSCVGSPRSVLGDAVGGCSATPRREMGGIAVCGKCLLSCGLLVYHHVWWSKPTTASAERRPSWITRVLRALVSENCRNGHRCGVLS